MIVKLYKGLLIAFLIGMLSFFIAPYIPGVNGVLLSFLLGVLIGNTTPIPAAFNQGIKYAGSRLLEYSIVLLAFGISFNKIAAIGPKFGLIVVMIISMILLTIFLAKRFNCPTTGGWLVGFGTAICGSSAIAALAPTVAKNSEDAGIAIAIVNLLGSVGMVLLPVVLTQLHIADIDSGVFIGATLHSVGNVAGAGYAMTPAIGDSALTIKLARVAMLSPAIIFFNILVNTGQKKSFLGYFKLPPYLWAFIAITILVSIVELPEPFIESMKTAGDLLLIISMAGIGLKISLRQLLDSGQKAMKFGILIFAVQMGLVALLLLIL